MVYHTKEKEKNVLAALAYPTDLLTALRARSRWQTLLHVTNATRTIDAAEFANWAALCRNRQA